MGSGGMSMDLQVLIWERIRPVFNKEQVTAVRVLHKEWAMEVHVLCLFLSTSLGQLFLFQE